MRKFLILALISLFGNSYAQNCGSCTNTISSSTTSNFTINNGEVLCVASGVTITGNIIIEDGMLCNEGIISGNVVLQDGVVNNFGTLDLLDAVSQYGGEIYNFGTITGGDLLISGSNMTFVNFGTLFSEFLNISGSLVGPPVSVSNFGNFYVQFNALIDSAEFYNNASLVSDGNINVSEEVYFRNQGNVSILNNLTIAATSTLYNGCGVSMDGNLTNNGTIIGPFTGYGEFDVLGNVLNTSSGQIAPDNSNIDICEGSIPGGISNSGSIGPNVTECSNLGACTTVPNNGVIYVYNDLSGNCSVDPGEYGVPGVLLSLSPANQIITTTSAGYAFLNNLPDGNYTLTIDTTNLNWSLNCPVSINFDVLGGTFSQNLYFGIVSNNPCPSPDVSVLMPQIRFCDDNQIVYVSACNEWTATDQLTASYVEVELPVELTLDFASLPYTALGNNVYRFETGDVLPGQCINFTISTSVSCNTVIGQSLCITANLFPVFNCMLDTIPSNPPSGNGTASTNGSGLNGFPQPCTLPWDQSSLSVDGWCANDSIYFTITNTGSPGGGDMECYAPMWITIDGVLTYSDSIMIAGGETITLVYPGNGQTWQLNASQHPLHPGNSQPNAIIEACGSDLTNWTPGGVDDVPVDDADPIVDIYCGPVQNSYDPNDKTGYPNGITNEHFIQPGQQLQYVIRFQNTGNDVAYNVVIRDTLDTDLNIFTVTPGVASHPYSFRMYGPRVLEWTFENINLPDSTSNEPGSHGFVTFHVEQVPDLSNGTVITNNADIYFDLNPPVITNETWHTIYEGFPSVVSVKEDEQLISSVRIYPNPTQDEVTILADGKANVRFHVLDLQGKVVRKGLIENGKGNISLIDLTNGIYLLKLEGTNEVVRIVKL